MQLLNVTAMMYYSHTFSEKRNIHMNKMYIKVVTIKSPPPHIYYKPLVRFPSMSLKTEKSIKIQNYICCMEVKMLPLFWIFWYLKRAHWYMIYESYIININIHFQAFSSFFMHIFTSWKELKIDLYINDVNKRWTKPLKYNYDYFQSIHFNYVLTITCFWELMSLE